MTGIVGRSLEALHVFPLGASYTEVKAVNTKNAKKQEGGNVDPRSFVLFPFLRARFNISIYPSRPWFLFN